VAAAAFCVVLDLAEHGGEVIEGVRKADQPLSGLAVRSVPQAIVDVLAYYGIRSLGMVFYLMSLLLLISALLVVYNMARDNEHLIFKSSGTRLQRAFLPLLLATLLASLVVTALREVVMPELILERDRLKPMVYHRGPRPKSITGTARDAEGQTFVFEIARYETSRHLCEGVRLYFPSRMAAGRLVRMEADAMEWDVDAKEWILRTAVPDGGKKAVDAQGHEVRYADYGLQHIPEVVPGDPQDDPVRYSLNQINRWTGQLTPSFIDSQEVGPTVVRATELWAASYRPEFRAELWRRACDWLTGIVLVLGCIPLLLGRQGSSRGLGIVLCILYGATYLVLTIIVPELTRSSLSETVPSWIPVLPHVAFFGVSWWGYYRYMET
jgi:lipopolysaccharide export LptBFGC system permease protein LptF